MCTWYRMQKVSIQKIGYTPSAKAANHKYLMFFIISRKNCKSIFIKNQTSARERLISNIL